MKGKASIDPEQLQTPSEEYCLFPIGHNLSCMQNDGDRKVLIQNWVKDRGSGGSVINVPWENGWIQDSGNIDRLLDTAQQLKNQGLHAWFYDEYFYPSGWGYGLAIPNPPENQSKNITYQHLRCPKGVTIELRIPEDASHYIWAAFYPFSGKKLNYQNMIPVSFEANRVSAVSPGDDYQLFAFFVRPSNVSHEEMRRPEELPGGPRKYLDFLDADAVAQFIDVALQPVADRTKRFGDVFDAIFTDEPALMTTYCAGAQGQPHFDSIPYAPAVFSEIEAEYGYSLLPYLPAVFVGNDQFSKTVRMQFYDKIGSLMSRNFTAQVQEWCHQNGTSYSGHFLLEEPFYCHVGYYGDFMKVISHMDYPGYDSLTGNPADFWRIGSAWNSSWFMGPKFVSSVSRNNGGNTTMLEICPVVEPAPLQKDPYGSFMALITFHTFCGATHINVYGYDNITDREQFRHWNQYTGRIQYLMRESVNDDRIGIYYPIHDAQAAMEATSWELERISQEVYDMDTYFSSLALKLFQSQLNFNILNDDAILNGRMSHGSFMAGQCAYDTLIFPNVHAVPLEVAKQLEKLQKAGVRLIFLDAVPEAGMSKKEHARTTALCRELAEGSKDTLDGDWLLELKQHAELQLSGNLAEHVFITKMKRGSTTLYYCINTLPEPAEVSVSFQKAGKIELFDPQNGSLQPLKGNQLKIGGWRGIFLLRFE